MKSDFCFVILHYKALDSTIMCIESIRNKVEFNGVEIVVVDNFSNNGSIEKIENKYSKFTNIHIIKSEKNVGFANGNNLGYCFARNELKSKYIAIINNDIEIIDSNLIKILKEEYEKNDYAVLGPKIILKDNASFLFHRDIDLKIAKRERINCIIKKIILNFGLTRIYNFIIQKRKKKKEKNNLNPDKKYENIMLHGSCLVFSPIYIDKFDKAFNTKTFLYYEEELLYIKLMRDGLKTAYIPNTKVKHYEDIATNLTYSNDERKKNIFKLKNQIKSLKIVIEELKNKNGGKE